LKGKREILKCSDSEDAKIRNVVHTDSINGRKRRTRL